DPGVRQVNPRCIMGDGAAIEEVPGLTIGVDGPAADDPCVEEIESLFSRPVDLCVGLGDQHRLSLVDRDLMRTDLNLEWHRVLPNGSRYTLTATTNSTASKGTAMNAARAAPRSGEYAPC